jgi:hypothetical protein
VSTNESKCILHFKGEFFYQPYQQTLHSVLLLEGQPKPILPICRGLRPL